MPTLRSSSIRRLTGQTSGYPPSRAERTGYAQQVCSTKTVTCVPGARSSAGRRARRADRPVARRDDPEQSAARRLVGDPQPVERRLGVVESATGQRRHGNGDRRPAGRLEPAGRSASARARRRRGASTSRASCRARQLPPSIGTSTGRPDWVQDAAPQKTVSPSADAAGVAGDRCGRVVLARRGLAPRAGRRWSGRRRARRRRSRRSRPRTPRPADLRAARLARPRPARPLGRWPAPSAAIGARRVAAGRVAADACAAWSRASPGGRPARPVRRASGGAQRVGQARRRLEARRRCGGGRPVDHRLDRRRQRRRRLGRPAGQRGEQDAAERVDVGAGVDLAAADLLGRGVAGRPDPLGRPSVRRAAGSTDLATPKSLT